MTDDQLLRYSRHILLEEIGVEGQERLLAAHALVIGAGGLGSPVALYLGTAGVGRITLVDHDDGGPDQPAAPDRAHHGARGPAQGRVGRARRSRAINPERRRCAPSRARRRRAAGRAGGRAPTWCSTAATTSPPATRSTRACVAHGKPLVSGAAIRFDGQISVFDPRDADVALLRLRVPARQRVRGDALRHMGVFAPLVGIIGAMQAAEALKLLSGAGPSLAGRLQMLDGRTMEWNEVRVPRNPACPVCGSVQRASLRA